MLCTFIEHLLCASYELSALHLEFPDMQHWSTPPCSCPAVPSDLISFLPFPPSFLDVQAQLKNFPQEVCIPTVLWRQPSLYCNDPFVNVSPSRQGILWTRIVLCTSLISHIEKPAKCTAGAPRGLFI